MARRCSDAELPAGLLQHRVERWLELEGVFTMLGFGDAVELDWEPGEGTVYLRRLDDGQVWRVDTRDDRPPSHARGGQLTMVSVARPGGAGAASSEGPWQLRACLHVLHERRGTRPV